MTSPLRAPRPAIAKLPDLFEGMNGTEKQRAVQLEAMRRGFEISSWAYEKITLKLADDCRYTPDFFVVDLLGGITFEEVKGFWRDDAKVKIRVAAQQFPQFTFKALQLVQGAWKTHEF